MSRGYRWKEWMTLSARDRVGGLVLALLTLGSLGLPYLLSPVAGGVPEAERLDSLAGSTRPAAGGREPGSEYRSPVGPFDPNTLPVEEWIAMGLPERKARTIRNYLARGGRFRKGEDLKKIYGMPPAFYEAVKGKIRIETSRQYAAGGRQYPTGREEAGGLGRQWKKSSFTPGEHGFVPVDINGADSAGLERLPGIGPVLAARILSFRERLGGFHSLEQLREVWGLRDSTRQLILPRLRLEEGSWQKLPVNTASREALLRHPYLRGAPGRLLVAYRQQHGPLLHPADLQRATGLSDSLLARLLPYLEFDPHEKAPE